MCVCVSVRHAANQSSRLSNSAHYSPPLIFPKSSQSEASPLLHSHFGSLMRQFSTCTYTHAKKQKKKTLQHITTQQNPTKHTAEVPQRSSQREGGRSAGRIFLFFFLRFSSDFSFWESTPDEYQKENKAGMGISCIGLNHLPRGSGQRGGRQGRRRGEKLGLGPHSLILPTEVKSFKWVELQDQQCDQQRPCSYSVLLAIHCIKLSPWDRDWALLFPCTGWGVGSRSTVLHEQSCTAQSPQKTSKQGNNNSTFSFKNIVSPKALFGAAIDRNTKANPFDSIESHLQFGIGFPV